MGSDRNRSGFPRSSGPPPLHRLCTVSRRTAARPLRNGKQASHFVGSQMPIWKSRSDLVVSHHLAGFLRAAARRLVASCCRSWGSPRFTRTWPKPAAILATRPPLEGFSPPPAVLRSPGALAPLAFALAAREIDHCWPRPPLARPSSSRRCSCGGSVTSMLVAERRRPVLPGLVCPLRGLTETVAGPCALVAESGGPDRPLPVVARTPKGLRNRAASCRNRGCSRRTVLRPP